MLSPQERQSMSSSLELAQVLSGRTASLGFMEYLSQVVIPSRPDPLPFLTAADPWQVLDAEKFAARLNFLSGITKRPVKGTPNHFWRTRPRGHDKTGQIARIVNFLLGFSRKPLNCIIAACDGEQATILLDSMKEEAGLNPWLGSLISYHAAKAEGPGGSLRVLKADAPSAYGQKADLIIYEEVTWWKKQDLFTALHSGKEKRPGCAEVVICNAGALGSWQHQWKVDCEGDPTWSVEEVPAKVHLASWMSQAEIAKMRKQLPPGIAARVIDNRWVSPSEAFGFLGENDILRCINPDLPNVVRNCRHYAGIDYGPKRDRTALAVVHREGMSDVVVVDELVVWQGSPDAPVQIEAVEQWCIDRCARYGNLCMVFDPYQMEATSQKFERQGRIVRRHEARGGKANYEMAENLRSLVANRRLQWRPGDGLLSLPSGQREDFREELLGLVMKIQPYGYRFDHTAGHHDDRACAVGMAALEAIRDPQGVPWLAPNDLAEGRPARDHKLIMGPDWTARGEAPRHFGRRRGDFEGILGLGSRNRSGGWGPL